MKSRGALPPASENRSVTRVPLASEHALLDDRALSARLEEQSVRITACKEQGMERPSVLSQHKLNPLHLTMILGQGWMIGTLEMKSATIIAALILGILALIFSSISPEPRA